MDTPPILVWIRRDLRLTDHAALAEAARRGMPVVPVFILDPVLEACGAAPKWRLGLGVERFRQDLRAIGSDLVLRKGQAAEVLAELVSETGAKTVLWQRAYLPEEVARDRSVKAQLQAAGLEARSFPGHLLFEPWTVQTKTGGFYKVFTPMWKAIRTTEPVSRAEAVHSLPAPAQWPRSDVLDDWSLGAAMNRGAPIVRPYTHVGEQAAQDRLAAFVTEKVATYQRDRDFPGIAATSGLSENLAYGEISPRQIWDAGQIALHEGAAGAETFMKELVWREFAYHLAWHSPHILTQSWKPEWETFPWATEGPQIALWQQGRTGERFVDAAMRQMYVTGTMHNRARMIVASYLTKHLMTHWRVGQKWFKECLIDWDPASNAMGWQWAAGCGPDAAPYFRVFNPQTQLEKFDKSGSYAATFIAEGQGHPPDPAAQFFNAVPRSWGLRREAKYPERLVSLEEGRKRALTAYESHKLDKSGPSPHTPPSGARLI